MMSHRWKIRISLFATVVVLAFSPMALPSEQGMAAASAECETCCPEKDSACVICGTKNCSSSANYYEARIGSPCAGQIAPSVPG